MPKQSYSKPALSIEQQISQLCGRGMVIADTRLASHYLSQINYYRLTSYWLPFESNHDTHAFQRGTNFEQVLDLYIFDRELRLLVLDAIERVEVAVRTQLSFHLGHRTSGYGKSRVSIRKRGCPEPLSPRSRMRRIAFAATTHSHSPNSITATFPKRGEKNASPYPRC
jgi:abortive infection bacteriophage resistance protein